MRSFSKSRCFIYVIAALLLPSWADNVALADQVLYGFEGDRLPQEDGWIVGVGNECTPGLCTESVEDGHFVLTWAPMLGEFVLYRYLFADGHHPNDFPPNLWAEARFRSTYALTTGVDWYRDGLYLLRYRDMSSEHFMLGDAISDGHAMTGLTVNEFYTVRFETVDSVNGWSSVDGVVFTIWYQATPGPPVGYLKIGGEGAQGGGAVNQWDFVRYGVITFGERIVATDPPAGFLDPLTYADCDRFSVTFDAPNFVYVNQIAVSAEGGSGGDTPQVKWVKRLDNGPADTVQVVLDPAYGGLPPGARTTFTFTDVDPADPDHPTIQTIAYTFERGDVNADGLWNLFDFAALQNCFDQFGIGNACAAFNYGGTFLIELADLHAFLGDFNTSGP